MSGQPIWWQKHVTESAQSTADQDAGKKGSMALSSFPLHLKHLCVWVFHLHACLYSMCTPGGHSESNLMGLELQMVVSIHVSGGNQTQDLWKTSQCSKPSPLTPPIFSPYPFSQCMMEVNSVNLLDLLIDKHLE